MILKQFYNIIVNTHDRKLWMSGLMPAFLSKNSISATSKMLKVTAMLSMNNTANTALHSLNTFQIKVICLTDN